MRHHSNYLSIWRKNCTIYLLWLGTHILKLYAQDFMFGGMNQGIILSNVPGKSLGLNFTLQDVRCSSQRSALTTFIKLQTCFSFVVRRWYELRLSFSGLSADWSWKTSKGIRVTENIEQKTPNKCSVPLGDAHNIWHNTEMYHLLKYKTDQISIPFSK